MSTIPENSTWRYHDILNNITIMYCDVIPLQHCKVLEFHPQQSGMQIILQLFLSIIQLYNFCLYSYKQLFFTITLCTLLENWLS